jgi:hypothetical protein
MADNMKKVRISSVWNSGARTRESEAELIERGRIRKRRSPVRVRDERAKPEEKKPEQS